MQLKQTLLSVLFLCSLNLMTSCSEEATEPQTGDIIIVNEGNFGQGNGSISLFNRETDDIENNAFAEANSGRELEASVQSVTVIDEVAFIVCNATDKIEIADANTLEALQAPLEEPDLVSPRYLAVEGDKAYVSVWGPFDTTFALTESRVAVIDLSNYSISKYIDVAAGPEDILAVGDKVFVASSFTNILTVIDTNTDEVTEEITLEGSPQLLAMNGGDLWVSITGAASQFVQIDPNSNSVANTISVTGSNSNGKFAINESLNTLYFIGATFSSSASDVHALSIDEDSPSYETIISGDHFYGIGTDPLTNDIFVGNSNAFQGEGTVLRYNINGQLLETYAVGVGPNGFVF